MRHGAWAGVRRVRVTRNGIEIAFQITGSIARFVGSRAPLDAPLSPPLLPHSPPARASKPQDFPTFWSNLVTAFAMFILAGFLFEVKGLSLCGEGGVGGGA